MSDLAFLAMSRRTNRLKGYDYSQNGAYFITICAKDNAQIFGHIRVGATVPVARRSN